MRVFIFLVPGGVEYAHSRKSYSTNVTSSTVESDLVFQWQSNSFRLRAAYGIT